MQEEMEKSYQVNTAPETLAKETHTARLTGVLVYQAGISPLMRGPRKSRESRVIRHPPPSISCFAKHELIFGFPCGSPRTQGPDTI